MLNTLRNAGKLRRQAVALVALREKAADARRTADVVETAAGAAFATAGDIVAGRKPATDPGEILTWLSSRVPAARITVDIPTGTNATGRARLTLAAVTRAAAAAAQRADRLKLSAEREHERFARVALRILQHDPVLAGAFSAAATIAGVDFSTDRFGQTADRFATWLAKGSLT